MLQMKEPTSFAKKIYELLCQVPKGKVTTYRELAHGANTKAYRAIGQIMRTNPYAPDVPCHRVVATSGKIGGFMGQTRGEKIDQKIAILKKEGVSVKDGKIVDFEKVIYKFK